MKKRFILIPLLLTSLLLSGCGNLQNSDLANNATNTSNSKTNKKSYQTTSSSNDSYSVLLQNGQYRVSPINGITATNYVNQFDMHNFEAGLMRISQNQFSINKFVFQEGQEISASEANSWLSRKDEKNNKDGLNPVDNGQTDEKKRNPIFVQTLLEQDYLTGSGNNYSVGGISVGIGLNATDYYTKVKDGPISRTAISAEQRRAEGEKAANQIVSRLRAKKGLKNVPIVVALFTQTETDALVGGNYFAYGVANGNDEKVSGWKTVDSRTQVLPVVGSEKAISGPDAEAFANFKQAISGYFPNLSGVIGKLHYQDGKLAAMNIQVNTQFYGYAQVESFSKLVATSGQKYLPKGSSIQIQIKNINNLQALVSKNIGDNDFKINIVDGNF